MDLGYGRGVWIGDMDSECGYRVRTRVVEVGCEIWVQFLDQVDREWV